MSQGQETTEQLSPLKRAIVEMREMRARLGELERRQRDPIAIVGVGLRLPGGAHDEASLWRLLADGVDAVTEIPPERWDVNAYYDPDPDKPGKMNSRHGAFLRDVDLFDAEFFGVSPREAISMDPQHRLLLETAWEALENAAISPAGLAGGQTGVFLGLGNSDYWRMSYSDLSLIDAYSALGSAFSVAAGRLSYFLGLHGPSMTVDTACSASLVALHLACQSLRCGECSLALAGGINLILSPEAHINFSKSRMLAVDGRCKTFDANADGYVRGEGCAFVVLKPLSAALAERNRVLAVILGSAVNQDGRSGGLTAPNGPAQEAVIREAVKMAGIAPREVSYLEAHGTGTSLGDPIEVRAAAAVYSQDRPADEPLALGSIKTNVGHLEAAAGIAGLLKIVLALNHKQIPPHLHLQRPNPFIQWEQWPLVIPTKLTPWEPRHGKRIAALSSFGFSGTNAHVIVEEPPPVEKTPVTPDRPAHILALSAKNGEALKQIVQDYGNYLDSHADFSVADVCFSANAGRAHFSHRLAIVGETKEQIRAGLHDFESGKKTPNVAAAQVFDLKPPLVAFLFTGQGSQQIDMGRALYETSPTFKRALDRCDEILRPLLGQPLLSVLYPPEGASSPLDQTAYTQPALFALEYALAELWRSWGVHPALVMGHSVGEYAAACVSGVFSLEDGLKLIAERARLMQSLPSGGAMAAIFASPERVAAVLASAKSVSLAAVNGPEIVTISGASAEVEEILHRLAKEGIKGKSLVVSHAFHSQLLEPILPAFEQVAAGLKYSDPTTGYISNLTGQPADARLLGRADYWRRHAREPVQFVAGVQSLIKQGVRVFVEIGPSPVLLGMARRCMEDAGQLWLPSLRPGRNDWSQMLEAVQAMYLAGVEMDWAGLDRDYPRQRLALPTYPFQRRHYWLDQSGAKRASAKPDPAKPWQNAKAAGLRQSRYAPLGVHIADYAAIWNCLGRLTTAHAANTLRELGAFAKKGESHDVDSLVQQFKIPAMYRHLLQRWLERLVDAKILRAEHGKFVSDNPLSGQPLAACKLETEQLLANDPDLLAYLRNCGDKLTKVIAGRESPLETLFPGGSSTMAERLYEFANGNRYVNSIAGSVVETVARSWAAERPLRILEVGAGTGGTSATLLPLLDSKQSEYFFTDVSDLFLTRGRQRFAAFPFTRFAVFDLEKDIAAQGFAPHSFDIIVGANVVHAARDLDGALKRIQNLLVPGGFLLLVEATQHHDWFDFTTGLIEGWQHFADDLRGDNPLLPPEKWESALLARGFAEVMAFPENVSPAKIMGQHVILARTAPSADGVAEVVNNYPEVTSVLPASAVATEAVALSAAAIQEFRRRLAAALPDEREDLMNDYVRARVMAVLRLEADRPPDRRARLMDLGLDSLMAVQLRNQLESGLDVGRTLPATLMFDYPTIEAISSFLVEACASQNAAVAPDNSAQTAPSPAPASASAQEIEALSDEEAEARLLKRLERE